MVISHSYVSLPEGIWYIYITSNWLLINDMVRRSSIESMEILIQAWQYLTTHFLFLTCFDHYTWIQLWSNHGGCKKYVWLCLFGHNFTPLRKQHVFVLKFFIVTLPVFSVPKTLCAQTCWSNCVIWTSLSEEASASEVKALRPNQWY